MILLKVCLSCLKSNTKLFEMTKEILKTYIQFSDLEACQNCGMQHYLCYECLAYVTKFMNYRSKCQKSYFILQEIFQKNTEVEISILNEIDRINVGLESSLSYLRFDAAYYEEVSYKCTKENKNNNNNSLLKDSIPVVHYEIPQDDFKWLELDRTENAKITEDMYATMNSQAIDDWPTSGGNVNQSNDLPDKVTTKSEDLSQDCLIEDFKEETDFDHENYPNDEDFISEAEIDKICDRSDVNKLDNNSYERLEYATVIPMSLSEAKAVLEIQNNSAKTGFKCCDCRKFYKSMAALKKHMQVHDKIIHGAYYCKLCKYHFKTEQLLKHHITENHMYKYICVHCTEVSYTRFGAKKHYKWNHVKRKPLNSKLRKSTTTKGVNEIVDRPETKPNYSRKQKIKDMIHRAIAPLEQYALVEQRRSSKNYLDSKFKCNFCYKGFKVASAYNNHMLKHDPDVSGELQCDICKLHFKSMRQLYTHMRASHSSMYSCQKCSFTSTFRNLSRLHQQWHTNYSYDCPHCEKKFRKISTRLTHIRLKHPSLYLCNLCGHSYVSKIGLTCHKNLMHTPEEIKLSETVQLDLKSPLYCEECKVQFVSTDAFDVHFANSSMHDTSSLPVKIKKETTIKREHTKRPRKTKREEPSSPLVTDCALCGEKLLNNNQIRRHYLRQHPDVELPKRYMCDVCGHTTREHANLRVHMRIHTLEKPFECPHCNRKFSMPSNRDRHLVVHTGEKPYECQHCNRRFTQSSGLKLHIQTVHLKIPYAPWDKAFRRRRREAMQSMCAPLPASSPQPLPKLILEAPTEYSTYATYTED